MTQKELFTQYLQDETLKVESLDWSPEGYQKSAEILGARLAELEAIAFEAKVRGNKIATKLREEGNKRGKKAFESTPWSAENLKNKSKDAWDSKVKEKKKVLSKLEKLIESYVTSGYNDDDILEEMGGSAKYTGREVREAIDKVRD